MLYGSIRRNLYAHLAIHKMRWTPFFDYLFTPISTPKWHETIWFCMKFYKLAISKNLVTMRFYGLLLRYIDLWKKANLQRYQVSYWFVPFYKWKKQIHLYYILCRQFRQELRCQNRRRRFHRFGKICLKFFHHFSAQFSIINSKARGDFRQKTGCKPFGFVL